MWIKPEQMKKRKQEMRGKKIWTAATESSIWSPHFVRMHMQTCVNMNSREGSMDERVLLGRIFAINLLNSFTEFIRRTKGS